MAATITIVNDVTLDGVMQPHLQRARHAAPRPGTQPAVATETGIYLLLSGLLLAGSMWWIRPRVS